MKQELIDRQLTLEKDKQEQIEIRSFKLQALISEKVVSNLFAYIGAAFVYHEESQGAMGNVLLGSMLVLASALSFAFYLYFSQLKVDITPPEF